MKRFVQLALDFLTGPEPVVPARSRPVAPQSSPEQPTPRRLRPAAPEAPAAEPLSAVFQPGTWHHPRANRLLKLDGCEVAYEFKRGKRRTIGLSVSHEGLVVSAPRWTPLGEVDALLRDKSGWVLEKLQRARERAGDLQRARIDWADGTEFEVLGQRVRLLLDPTHTFGPKGVQFEPAEAAGVATLRVGLARHAQPAQIRDAAQAWLMKHATVVFTERLHHFAPQLGVHWGRLRLSSAGTRWGSASADGTIRLNWRLVFLSLEMVDYVVVHELSHLRHMDHSPQFWDVVASVMPDHALRRRSLKQAALPLND